MEKYIPKVGDKFTVDGIYGCIFDCDGTIRDETVFGSSDSSIDILSMDVRKLDFIKIE